MSRILLLSFVLAVAGLGSVAQAQSADDVSGLIAKLGDADEEVRVMAAARLGGLGATAAPAIPALIASLSDEAGRVRGEAARTLGLIGPSAAEAVAPLMEALTDEDDYVRGWTARALGLIGGQAAAPAVPALIEMLSDPKDDVRNNASVALAEIGIEAEAGIPALIAALSHEDVGVRFYAARAMGEIGKKLKEDGTVLLSVVPRVYWKEFMGLLLALVAWFALARRFPKQRPESKPKLAGLFVLVVTPPLIIACKSVHYALTRMWAEGFVPDMPITQLPLPVAAVLTVGFSVVLAGLWACLVKKQDDTAPTLAQAD